MIIFHNKHKAHAFWGAAFVLLIAMLFTGCTQPTGGSGSGIGGTVHEAPFVEGGASLILSPDKLDIKVKAVTSDGNPVVIEGCNETELASDTETELHAKSTTVILKGKIIELYCGAYKYNGSYNNIQNKLTALNVQGLNALQVLSCSANQLTALDVQGLTALRRLECNVNQLTVLNVQGLAALETLGCYYNQLTVLNVQGCTALKDLYCGGNKLTVLNAQSCTALEGLWCLENQLTALNVQGCTSLQMLWCGNNQLTELNVQGLTALQSLGCSNNQLTALNVQGLTALKSLDCRDNQLAADAFKKLFGDLPQRADSDNAKCILYTERTDVTEGNHTDFTAPPDLAAAFDNAKNNKKWKMYKIDADGFVVKL